jgi:putative ABC transport system permease protein
MADWKQVIDERLASLNLEPAREAAIVEELAQYLDDHYAELLASGVSEVEAVRRTLAELSGSEILERELRRVERQPPPDPIVLGTNRRTNMIADLWQDLCYGARTLLKNPGFTLIAVLTLGLGIGANTAIFSVVNGVLLRALPFPEPERILNVLATDIGRGQDRRGVSYPNFADWRVQQSLFERFAAFDVTSATLTGAGSPEQLRGINVSADLFPLLGVQPLLGRWFSEQEAQAGDATAIIISEGLWRRHFGADPQIVGMAGRAITLNSQSCVIIGVMPASFSFPLGASRATEFWRLLKPDQQRGNNHLNVIARLKPGVTMAQAQAGMNTVAGRMTAQYPQANTGRGIRVIGLQEDLTRNVRRALLMLLASVGCVLLIACANVANLLLARVTGRQREIAVRMALGATRGRVIRQLLAESALLACTGGALGLLLAAWGIASFRPLLPPEVPLVQAVTLDWHVLSVTLALSCLTGIFFGSVPALQASKANLTTTLKEEGRGLTGGVQRNRMRAALVIAEIALSLLLLVGAGLLMRSFLQLLNVHPGFNPERVIAFDFALPGARYAQKVRWADFYQQLTERVAGLPGVEAAGVGDPIPLGGTSSTSIFIEGQPLLTPAERPKTRLHFIGQNYLRVLGIPLLTGRPLDENDRMDTPKVILINETFAHQHFPNKDPLGQRVGIAIGDSFNPQIVGVVGDVKARSLEEEAEPACYLAYLQYPISEMSLVVRTTAPDATLIFSAVRKEVAQLDPELAISDIRTMSQLVTAAVAPQRFFLLTLGLFAGLALLLAAIGIYSVMAYNVTQRTHEIGIRLALGARPAEVLRLLLRQGMRLAGIGVGIGLLAVMALTRLLNVSLFGVGANDPLILTAITLLLLGVALLACWIPARRATSIDPLVALRCD